MENEKVREFKDAYKKLEDDIYSYYDFAKGMGATKEELRELTYLVERLHDIKSVSASTVKGKKIILDGIEEDFKDLSNRIFPVQDEEDDEVLDAKVKPAKKSALGKAVKGIAIALAVVCAAGACYHTGVILFDRNKEKSSEEETMEDTETETQANQYMDESEIHDYENNRYIGSYVDELIPGQYGTFTDINDDEQIRARAQYLYDTYATNMWENIDDGDKHLITVDNIANMIRALNGQLVLDENGNQTLSANSLNDMVHVFCALVVDGGSKQYSPYKHFPAYLLAVDGSETSELIKSYDQIYDKLVYSMNVGDDEQAQDAIACLGYKYLNEWHLQGMNGGVNALTLPTNEEYLAILATWLPYNTNAFEWMESKQTSVCIDACIDYETGEVVSLPVNDIHAALESGVWNNYGWHAAGIEEPIVSWMEEYYIALENELEFKYDHRNTLTLN